MFFQKMSGFLLCLLLLSIIGCDEVPDEVLDGPTPDADLDDSVSISPGDIPSDDTKLFGDVVIVDPRCE